MVSTYEAGHAYPSWGPEFTVFLMFVLPNLYFYELCLVDYCLSFFFLPLQCLSFDLRPLIAPFGILKSF